MKYSFCLLCVNPTPYYVSTPLLIRITRSYTPKYFFDNCRQQFDQTSFISLFFRLSVKRSLLKEIPGEWIIIRKN